MFGNLALDIPLFFGDDINRLLYYAFRYADANPLDSPIATEKGQLIEIQDNAGNNAIASSELLLGGSSGAGVGDQGGAVYGTDAAGNPFVHEGGLVFGARWRHVDALTGNKTAVMGMDSTNLIQSVFEYEWRTGAVGVINVGLNGIYISTGINADDTGATTYESWIVLTDDGKVLFYADLEGNGYATLYWIADQQALSTVYAHLWGRQADLYIKTAAVAKYALTVFDAPYRYAGAVPESTSGNAPDGDATFEVVATTLPSAGSIKHRFRKQDDSNYWELEINSAGDSKINEIVSGSPTTRISALAALAGGETVKVRLNNTTIQLYHNTTLDGTYSSAANFKTETAIELNSLGTGGVLSDMFIWHTHAPSAINAKLEATIKE